MEAHRRQTRRRTRRMLLAAFGLLASAPALAATAGPEPAGGGPPPAIGDVVARLEVVVPFAGPFVVRGTVPLPLATWSPGGIVPLAIREADGSAAVTQVEVVSRYAAAEHGVDVVEVLARVRPPAGAVPGDRVHYDVVVWPTPAPPGPGSAGIEDLLQGPKSLPPAVVALLGTPASVEIRAEDVFGNVYRARPFDGTGAMVVKRHGPVATELRVSQVLTPAHASGAPVSVLSHFLGVHAYVTATSGEEVVGFDLRFHDAHSGLDPSDPLDDPLGRVYFRRIQVVVPPGWVAIQDYLDPFVGIHVGPDGSVAYDVVRPLPGGKVHVIDWQQQFHRRIALAPLPKVGRAVAVLRGAGLGFARRGVDPASGHAYWSWWNLDTARWFPQAHPLPSLEHVGHSALRAQLASELAPLQAHLEKGTSDGSYPVQANVLGWAHPYGIAYGGMTSGTEINLNDGITTVEAASLDGYRLYRILHRMNTDRMPVALYDADGTPSSVEEWLVVTGDGKDYVPFTHFHVPKVEGKDPFGLWKASKIHVQVVEWLGLQPHYAPELESFAAYDYQHLIRYTRAAKVLAWLANDSLAKDDILLLAETFHLSYHRWYNSPGQYVQITGLRNDMDHVAQNPGNGLAFGRGEGWGLDCATAAYATAPPAWRAKKKPWFDDVTEVLLAGQGACNGFIQALQGGKLFDGKYRARQTIEQSIVENTLLGILQRVHAGADPARAAMVRDVLVNSLYAAISPMAWSLGQTSPWAITAVGPPDEATPLWCWAGQIPADGLSPWTDSWQNWSSFAYGFELTLDPIFLAYAKLQLGGPIGATLHADGTKNIANRAALLALDQVLSGTL